MNSVVIGIDPGKNGGLSRITRSDGQTKVEVVVMPLTGNGLVDIALVIDWVMGSTYDPLIVIEKQMPRRMQGVSRAGVMMQEYGRILGALWTYRTLEVLPKVWQARMIPNAATGATKTESIRAIKNRYSNVNLLRTPRCKTPHDGMSDAILIADYGFAITGGY